MNVVSEYLRITGCSQRELAEILAKADPRIDQALVSKMNTGVCLPSEAIVRYLCGLMHWPSDAFLDPDGEIIPPHVKTAPKWPIYEHLLIALEGSSESYPYSREYLAKRLGITDRALRRMKEEAIADGCIIGSSSYSKGATKGYYLPQTRDELLRILGEYTSRSRSINRSIRAIKKALNVIPGQVRMDDDGKIHDDD